MITENLSTLKIHKLTQRQYDREVEAGRIDENALYLIPDESGAAIEAFETHIEDSTKHITSDERTKWNTASTTASSAQTKADEAYALADTKVPTTRKVNNKLLSADITLNASDVGADAAGTAKSKADAAEAAAKTYTDGKIANLLNNSTEAVDSIMELAEAMEENAGAIEALNGIAGGKADKSHTHDDRYYAKSEIDTKVSTLNTAINGKAASSHSHAISDVTSLQSALDGKSNTDHTHNYAGSSSAGGAATSANKVNKSLTVQLNSGSTEGTDKFTFDGSAAKSINITPSKIGASASGHNHDDRYYTETEMDTKLSGKADKSHKHAVTDITDLTATVTELNYMGGVTSGVQAQLDGKVPTTRKVNNKALSADISLTYTDVGAAPSSHNHSAANITSGILGVARGGTGNNSGYVRIGAEEGSTIGTLATAEGRNVTASGSYCHAEGNYTEASGSSAHAEGQSSTASGVASHAEGNNATASGNYSHAEGDSATASGNSAHAEGYHTLASSDYQHVQGKFNIEDKNGDYAHIVGNGDSTTSSNAHTVDWYGNGWFAGDVYVGGADQSNGVKLVDSNDIIPVENGGTGATEVLSAANNLEVYSLTQGAAISEGTDLNDLVNVGNYRCAGGSVSNSLINSPCPGWLFMLKVGYLPNNPDYLYQEVIKYDNNKRYYRRKRQNEDWSEWNENFSSSDIIPVENGGTGASTPAGARTNLEITPENIGALSTANGGTVAGFTELKGGYGRGNEVAEAASLIDSPADGIQYSSATNGVGILKIVLPQDLSANTMVKFDVDIYSYSRQSIVTYTFGGQIYTSSTDGTYGWANRTWDIQGTHRQDELLNLPITFGRHDSKAAISIGCADTEWGYNIVTIKNITAFYNNYGFARWSNGWQIILDANPLAEALATASNPIAESRTNLGITSSTTVPTTAPVTGEGSVCFVVDNGAPTPIAEGGTGGITLLEAADNLQVPSLTQGESLAEGDDLNNITTIGNYRASNAALSETLLNCPCAGYFFMLRVGHLPNNPTYLYQEIIVTTNGTRWYRRKYGSEASWSEWVKDFNSSGYVPLENGGTGNTLKNAPNNAIVRKAVDSDYLWYTPTKSGAFYATAENGSPQFGILPRGQGGTGFNYRYDTVTTTKNATYSDDEYSGGTRFYPYLDMCFTRQYHETAAALTAGTTYNIATIPADYAPGYTTALTVDSSKNISAYIDSAGKIFIRPREAVGTNYSIRISGWWTMA